MRDKKEILELLQQIDRDQQKVFDGNLNSLSQLDCRRLSRIGAKVSAISEYVRLSK